jgi:CheY-like chemotaxis protein
MRRERRPRPSILVIDDDPRATSFLSQYLLPEGHDVTCAYSGLHALMTVENKTPDVILLDLIMPDMDGFEVLTMLRRDEQLKHVPVVLLTPRSLSAEERSRILSDAQALVATQGAAPHDELAVMRTQLQSMGLLLPRPSASR